MEYIFMLQRAWQILTRHKILWLFGLMAVLAGQDALFYLHGGQIAQPLPEAIINLPSSVGNWVRSITTASSGFVWISLTILIGLVLLAIGVTASAALIGLVQSAERGDPIDFKSGLRLGLRHLDRLIVLRLIFNLPFIVFSYIGVLLLLDRPKTEGWLFFFLILLLSVGALLGGIGIGADRAVVIDGLGIVAALRQGWETLRDHFSKYFVLSGIFISTLLMLALVLFCPVALLFAERVTALAQTSPLGADLTATLLSEPSGGVLVIIGVLVYAGITAFTSITWTIAYRRYAR